MAISKEQFRKTLGAFPAGVTIVTSSTAEGEPVGATVSAFMSVSIEPPLVLVSLNRGSRTAAAIAAHGSFVVHFVNEATTQLALRFAAPGDVNKFDGLRSARTRSGVLALLDCDIRLSCSVHAQHEGGDHLVFIGHVEQVDVPESSKAPSVVWHDRRFCQLVALPAAV